MFSCVYVAVDKYIKSLHIQIIKVAHLITAGDKLYLFKYIYILWKNYHSSPAIVLFHSKVSQSLVFLTAYSLWKGMHCNSL